MPYAVSNSFVGLGIEGTRGSVASTFKWIPVTNPQVTPNQTFLRDEALRGSPVTTYDHVEGVVHTEYDANFYLYADTFPILVRGILGGTDTITPVSSKYSHLIKLLNDNTSGSQPPSLSIKDFDGVNAFQILGNQMSTLNLKFGAEAASEVTTKFVGNDFTSISTPTSPSISTESFVPGWNVTTSIGGTAYNYVAEGEINIERSAAPIFTGGQQGPRVNFAGPIAVTGRLMLVTDTNADPFMLGSTRYGLDRNAIPVVITFTDPVTSDTIAVTMTATQFHDPKHSRGKAYVETEVSFTANANATDATSGYSPIQITTVNSIPSY